MRRNVVDGEGIIIHDPCVVCDILVGGSDAEVEIVKVIDVMALVILFELHRILTGGEEYGQHRVDWNSYPPIVFIVIMDTHPIHRKRCFTRNGTTEPSTANANKSTFATTQGIGRLNPG